MSSRATPVTVDLDGDDGMVDGAFYLRSIFFPPSTITQTVTLDNDLNLYMSTCTRSYLYYYKCKGSTRPSILALVVYYLESES